MFPFFLIVSTKKETNKFSVGVLGWQNPTLGGRMSSFERVAIP